MNFIKKPLVTLIIYILIMIFIITVTNYIGLINYNISTYLIKILTLLGIFIFNFKLGQNKRQKGLIRGIKYSLGIVISFSVLNLLTGFNFGIKTLIYYILIIITSTFSNILGVNKNKS